MYGETLQKSKVFVFRSIEVLITSLKNCIINYCIFINCKNDDNNNLNMYVYFYKKLRYNSKNVHLQKILKVSINVVFSVVYKSTVTSAFNYKIFS